MAGECGVPSGRADGVVWERDDVFFLGVAGDADVLGWEPVADRGGAVGRGVYVCGGILSVWDTVCVDGASSAVSGRGVGGCDVGV